MPLVKLCKYNVTWLYSIFILCNKVVETEDLQKASVPFFPLRLLSCTAAPGPPLSSVAGQPVFASDE